MGRGYSSEEIRSRLIEILNNSKTGMSGVEISEMLTINRSTMTKYLKVFAAEGLLRQKNIGNLTLWSLESGQEAYDFPADYFRVATLFLDFLLNYYDGKAHSLIKNCISSGATVEKLISEVMVPAIYSVNNLFDEGKIGNSEQKLLHNNISNIIQIFNQLPLDSDTRITTIVISADPQNNILSEAASSSLRSLGWSVFHLGDMSSTIDILFDLDLQKLLGKIPRNKSGVLVVVVFSNTAERLNFFSDSVRSIRHKSRRPLKLVLCGKAGQKTSIASDFASDKFDDIIRWFKAVSENLDV